MIIIMDVYLILKELRSNYLKIKIMSQVHSFHIPVMGVGFTIDTPVKIAHYGISSVVALVDDMLLEKMRKFYLDLLGREYITIDKTEHDYRAKRITAYLNLLQEIVEDNFKQLKELPFESGNDLEKYFELLPDSSELKMQYCTMLLEQDPVIRKQLQKVLKENMKVGSIDTNIMTKIDGYEYSKKEGKLDDTFRKAHSSLRGFAKSNLKGAVVLSAGINPHLFSYFEELPEFLPNDKNEFDKKVILKVSDYRSALLQGKMLAKKGVWVSEYRIESGLNCGGHAFATNGLLLGPILKEFKDKRLDLYNDVFELYNKVLSDKGISLYEKELPQLITAQGGIGNAKEHDFLLNNYSIDSAGWGTPFLLVPEVVNVDKPTLQLLSDAKEDDLYLSKVSPLGVYFNNIKNSSAEIERVRKINKDRPGSSCPKKYLAFNTEFTEEPICVASRQYQDLKIKELQNSITNTNVLKKAVDEVTEKTCLCLGLGTSALIVNDIDHKTEGEAVEICPGPNLAYFSKIVSLKEMVDHVYGKIDLVTSKNRPHMFVKELHAYVDYLKNELLGAKKEFSRKELKTINSFKENLVNGINYYQDLFANIYKESIEQKLNQISILNNYKKMVLEM